MRPFWPTLASSWNQSAMRLSGCAAAIALSASGSPFLSRRPVLSGPTSGGSAVSSAARSPSDAGSCSSWTGDNARRSVPKSAPPGPPAWSSRSRRARDRARAGSVPPTRPARLRSDLTGDLAWACRAAPPDPRSQRACAGPTLAQRRVILFFCPTLASSPNQNSTASRSMPTRARSRPKGRGDFCNR